MGRLGFLRGKKGLLVLGGVVVLALAGGLWLERTPLLAWYYVRSLAAAGEADRDRWAERVAGLEDAALPGLIDCLGRDDARICANARAALACLARSWGTDDPRCVALAEQLGEAFPGRSLPGQLQLLELLTELVTPAKGQAPPAAGFVGAAGTTLRAAGCVKDADVQARALALADLLAGQAPPARVLDAIHAAARAGLTARTPGNRVRAVLLTRSPALKNKTDLLELVLPLLRDSSAEVRREALRAVGLRRDVISDEDLLSWLHDPDREVQRWCEKALLARGRTETEIQLGRLITDVRATERLKVFGRLRRARDVEAGVWIRHLCDDPEPAVRIAAARAAAEQDLPELSERLREMAQNDRSPTVRQVVEHYARMRRPDR
jgi:hypothetical protein